MNADTIVALGLIAAAAVTVLAVGWSVFEDLHPFPKVAASAHDETTAPTRANCSVALCDDEPTVTVYASNEFWDFCVEHGTPYLIEGLAS